MDEDEQSSIVQSLRGGGPAPLARPLLDDDDATDHTESVEVLFAETARAQRRATDLESASPHFAGVLGAFSHRATAAMLAPLWFATLVGPYFTGPSMFVGDGGWLGGLALAAAIISVPLQYWIRHLANNWPSSYDACLRARVPEDEEGEGTSASLEVATKSAKPPGSTMLRLAAVLAPLLSVL